MFTLADQIVFDVQQVDFRANVDKHPLDFLGLNTSLRTVMPTRRRPLLTHRSVEHAKIAELGCDLVNRTLKSHYVPDYLKAHELGFRYRTGCARDPAT